MQFSNVFFSIESIVFGVFKVPENPEQFAKTKDPRLETEFGIIKNVKP